MTNFHQTAHKAEWQKALCSPPGAAEAKPRVQRRQGASTSMINTHPSMQLNLDLNVSRIVAVDPPKVRQIGQYFDQQQLGKWWQVIHCNEKKHSDGRKTGFTFMVLFCTIWDQNIGIKHC